MIGRSQFAFGEQLSRFAAVGAMGFVVDVAVLYTCLALGMGFYGGRAVSFLFAASFTWWFNRSFTFGRTDLVGARSEWLRFVASSLSGGAVNLGLYAALIQSGWPFDAIPAIAVAVGSMAGLSVNFATSRYLVFR